MSGAIASSVSFPDALPISIISIGRAGKWLALRHAFKLFIID